MRSLAVTRADLADAGRGGRAGRCAVPAGGSRGWPAAGRLPVSAVTGRAWPSCGHALRTCWRRCRHPAPTAGSGSGSIGCFTVRGAGTVVTGTLGAGRLSVGDQLELRQRRYPIRGIQQLGLTVAGAAAVARVAVNLRGLDRAGAPR